jgi:xanthine dehydrogenase accessory factor
LQEDMNVLVKGGGDLASGVVHRLHRAGMRVIVTELPQPTVIRRAVAFAAAMHEDLVQIEGVRGRRVVSMEEALLCLESGDVPVLSDPEGELVSRWRPEVVVDAIIAKRNLGTKITQAPIVIGLGPGFVVGLDVHAVIETKRGHHLGRVILEGSAAPDTGIPGEVMGYTAERVLRAPCAGVFWSEKRIGDEVEAGEAVAYVDGSPVVSGIGGVIRGLLANGFAVREGMKAGDVDPRGVKEYCFTISDKARAIGGGVLEAVLYLRGKPAVWLGGAESL